jgi:hypothetical protein
LASEHPGLERAALQHRFIEGGVFRFRAQELGVHAPGHFQVDQGEIGRAARLQPPAGQFEQLCRTAGHGREQRQQRDRTVVIELQGRGQQRLHAQRAVGGLGEGAALHIGVLRVVAGDDHIDVAAAQAIYHGPAVLFPPQRRLHLAIAAVLADIEFVQRQMVDGDAACHRIAGGFRGADGLERGGAGDGGGVIAPARQADEAQVALDDDGLGLGRHAGQAEPAGHLALVHHAAEGEIGVLQVMHDEPVEVVGIAEDQPHQLGVGEAALAVGEGKGARLAQQADLGHLLAGETLRHRRHRVDMDDRGVAGAALDEIHQRHIVDSGLGVGHDDDGGDAPGGGGAAGRGERLAMLLAGLAGENLHVDQAGRQHMAAAVDALGPRRSIRPDMRADIGDRVAPDEQAAPLVTARERTDQPGVEEDDLLLRGEGGLCGDHGYWLGRWRASAWSTAIRTATPISTCSRMTLRL